jgi:hypothetical protein
MPQWLDINEVARENARRAFMEAGYYKEQPDGAVIPDHPTLAIVLYNKVTAQVVMNKRERTVKGRMLASLLEELVPDLAGPTEWENEPDPELAKRTWRAAVAIIRHKFLPTGRIQSINRRLNGHRVWIVLATLTHPETGQDVEYAYATADLKCIIQDVNVRSQTALDRVHERQGEVQGWLYEMLPELAEDLQADYQTRVHHALESGEKHYKAQLEMATDDESKETAGS